ncbi:MAG: dockerin type I domain-containing protein [Rubripirellula sp.]
MNIENQLIDALDGDDTIDVTGNVEITGAVEIVGGANGDGSDVLNFTAGALATNLNLESSTISVTPPLLGDLVYGGIEHLNVAGSDQDFNVSVTDGDDHVEYTPLGLNAGQLRANNDFPIVQFDAVANFEVDTLGGQNRIVVHGTNGNDAFTVTPTAVTAAGREAINYLTSVNGGNVLTVNGHEGSDVFATTSSDSVPFFIDGGDPIGAGDVLVLNAITSSVFAPGPEGDEGQFVIDGNESVSFDHIEAVTVSGGGLVSATVLGTPNDDQITVIGTAARDADIAVNDGPLTSYVGLRTLQLESHAGDDDIDVVVNEFIVLTTVDGGDPVTDEDTLTVTGVNATATWSPDSLSSGRLMSPTQAIDAVNLERFVYVGLVDESHLVVDGTPDANTFVHTPGDAVDRGSVQVDSLLPVEYVELGAGATVLVQGLGGNDSLVALGTEASDSLEIRFPGDDQIDLDLTSSFGTHVDLLSLSVENFRNEGRGGSDVFDVHGKVQATTSFSIVGDDDSDTLNLLGTLGATVDDVVIQPDANLSSDQNVTGLGTLVDVSAIELITFAGQGSNDSLDVDLGTGDNVARVERVGDRGGIFSDSLPPIEFIRLDKFSVTGNDGSDVVTVKTRDLIGANPNDYRFEAGISDTLVIEGADGAQDLYTLLNPSDGSVAIIDASGSFAVVTASDLLGRLQVNTLGDDDTVRVRTSLGSGDVIGVPITFDGGAGSDLLETTGSPSTAIDEVIYTPGPQVQDGRLVYEDAANEPQMVIDFTNLEPVNDFLVAANLTVNSTGAANSISYTQGSIAANGLVAVDGFETIEFNNKTHLNLNGNGGSDEFSLNNPSTPTALTGITVNGGDPTAGSDVAIVSATTGADAINFAVTTDDDAVITGAGPIPITLATVESAVIDGQGGNDALTYTSPAADDSLIYTPGADFVSGSISGVQIGTPNSTLMPLSFSNIGNGSVTFADPGGARLDDLFVQGTDNDDRFDVSAAGVLQISKTNHQFATVSINTPGVDQIILQGLDGDDTFNVPGNHPFTGNVNAPITIEGGTPDDGSDVLNFAGAGAAIASDLAARTVTEAGFGAVAISGVETVNIAAADAALSAILTADDDQLTYRPTGAAAGTFQNENDNTTFNFTAATSTFTVNALASVGDHVIVEGTNSHDQIIVDSPNRTVTVTDAAGTELKTVTLAVDVESVTAQARNGNDTFLVVPAPTVGGIPNGNLLVNVDGGGPGASDALVIATAAGATLPASDFVVNAVGLNPGEGRVRVFRNAVATPDISYANTEIVSPNVVVNGGVPQLLVMGPDTSEPNEYRTIATHLGAGDTINVDNLAVFPNFGEHPGAPADVDFFQVFAASTGTLDVTAFFETYNPALLPAGGQLGLNVLDASGNVIAGAGTFGNPDASPNARVRFPAVQGQVYFVSVFGANADGTANNNVVNGYELSILNEAPPVPFDLELLDNPADGTTNLPGGAVNSDTGRSQFDNHTYDTTPTIYFRLDDGIFLNDLPGNPATDSPPDEIIQIPFQAGLAQPAAPGYAIAIFDEGDTPPQTGSAVQTPLGFATAVPGQQGIYEFTVPDARALSEGSHFLSARVQMLDPANPLQTGFGARSESLEIVVDITPPPITFGDPGSGLHPDSDSGDAALAGTQVDRITNDLTPTFYGRAEANALVRAYLDANDNGVLDLGVDVLIGQTVATPLDGTNQAPRGEWEITSTVNMNDPTLLAGLGFDGLRRIFVTAEDLAGNITSPVGDALEIFIDTQGPQVTNVFITGNEAFNLFTLKPDTPEPTPRVDSLTIAVQDLPARVAAFLYSAVSNVPPLAPIVLQGDHSGAIPISTLNYNVLSNGPGIATGEIVLTFDEPLPDDRFTLTLQDSIIDPSGNALDGENNAAEPIGAPVFPTGDGIPGSNFVARFTVDSRAEVATWSQGLVYADINGNFVWDPQGEDNDFTNRDFIYNFGEQTDAYFVGNFAPVTAASASGFDKVGAYGAFNGVYQFFLDTNDDGVGDTVGSTVYQVNMIPVAGDFNAAHPGDEIGGFDGQNWYMDVNGNNNIDVGERFATNLRGLPVVGDFNGDGADDLATYNNDTGIFQFDLNRDGNSNNQLTFGFTGFGERPVASDMNLDGVDDIAMWVPGREGQLPKDAGEFHFLLSDNVPTVPVVGTLPSNVFDDYSPAPLGNDLISQFGDDFALPLLGNFDPPIGKDAQYVAGSVTNTLNRYDVNVDGDVTPSDILSVINTISDQGSGEFKLSHPLRAVASFGGSYVDVNGDSVLSPADILQVIEEVARLRAEGLGELIESDARTSGWLMNVDSFFAGEDEEDDIFALLSADPDQLF